MDTDQDKVSFFKLMSKKISSVSSAANYTLSSVTMNVTVCTFLKRCWYFCVFGH
ncbi:hypothetical protein BCV72DRAFT_232754 [Rhizopus microsporus var. microsporus]|uniref:Uncharacterized protein n=2 Tax=Rhizopus microsporus TaxID=58291 RepID=A0A2G4SUE5_RHIZD|nr:uncharacterized protein RHIMIDRAFT_281923 [Rhizopus microsporus ATCC 52813]ORE03632.1 hypothetical protein BCV72DRAFT_232754 [Rhizopus microsporus var. microsporus]PHZ12389.1 hypothetical protein RHIMIDRAFT_281923 [Rhizopus microsporus ATCC 52813]